MATKTIKMQLFNYLLEEYDFQDAYFSKHQDTFYAESLKEFIETIFEGSQCIYQLDKKYIDCSYIVLGKQIIDLDTVWEDWGIFIQYNDIASLLDY